MTIACQIGGNVRASTDPYGQRSCDEVRIDIGTTSTTVSRVAYSVGMLCCITTALRHQTFSVRLCVLFAGCVAGHATS